MDTERMRRVLAEVGMGWVRTEGKNLAWYDNALGQDSGYRMSKPMQEKPPFYHWVPDIDWKQCGMVIEAMREKGWDWHMSMYASGVISVGLRHEETGKRFSVDVNENYGDERYARMLAAARALEAANA